MFVDLLETHLLVLLRTYCIFYGKNRLVIDGLLDPQVLSLISWHFVLNNHLSTILIDLSSSLYLELYDIFLLM